MKASWPLSPVSIGAVAPLLAVMIRSAMRPPQPVSGWLVGGEDCQYAAWSACEYSCGGKAYVPVRYCACVVGRTSVPTLATMAAWPPLNKFASSGIDGCNAYWMPSPEVIVEFNACKF